MIDDYSLIMVVMYARDITRIASLHLHTRPYFGGCVAADCLPLKIPYYPIFFICNSDRWYQQGTHWLLIMLRSKDHQVEFFDSLGREPAYYNKLIEDFLVSNSAGGGGYVISKCRVQDSDSTNCGSYCLMVADYFCQGYGLQEILSLFDKRDLWKNERMVENYLNNHMKRIQ